METEKDVGSLLKELANYKLQLEAKDSAYSQLLLELEQYQNKDNHKNNDFERDIYIQECIQARFRINELETKVKELANQLLETGKLREQFPQVVKELKIAQRELLNMETELTAAKEDKLRALMQAELMETSANMEKDRAEDLMKHVAELNEALLMSKMAVMDAEKEKCLVLTEKDVEVELAMETIAQAQDQVEEMKKQLEMLQELETQLLAKSVLIDSLRGELNQRNELLSSSEKAFSDTSNELIRLKAELEVKEIKNSDKAFYIEALETELNRLKSQLRNTNEEELSLKSDIEALMNELQKLNVEIGEVKHRENEAQLEKTLLKSELHKARSKLAAAEAAEVRAGSVKSGLYLAVQQLAVEAEEAKKENHRLKRETDKVAIVPDDFIFVHENSNSKVLSQTTESEPEPEETREKILAISVQDYESLISNQLVVKDSPENNYEMEFMKKELEVAMARIAEFRTRAEQATTRAEAAERAKMLLEEQLRKWKEQRQKRKAALAALREETASIQFIAPTFERTPGTYQPLGKVLNLWN